MNACVRALRSALVETPSDEAMREAHALRRADAACPYARCVRRRRALPMRVSAAGTSTGRRSGVKGPSLLPKAMARSAREPATVRNAGAR